MQLNWYGPTQTDVKFIIDIRSTTKILFYWKFESLITMQVLPTFFLSKRMDEKCSGSFEMTDKRVQFCLNCDSSKCNVCDKTFDKKKTRKTSTFHQIKSKFTTFVTQNNSEIIVDIGCPNTVISIKDETNFKNNLNKFQQENLWIIEKRIILLR